VPPRGTLYLVVGPSGAGKDSLIGAARKRLAGAPDIAFARRVITRPVSAGGEPHEPADARTFARLRDAGGFMLCWRAHDTDYGVPAAYEARLGAGCSVVANVSRGVIADAAARYDPVRVVEVTAPPDLLARRLEGRGREDAGGIARRLARTVELPSGVPTIRVTNDGAFETALDAFLAALGRT